MGRGALTIDSAIDATLVDMRGARRRASDLPIGVNPWATVPIAIASVDYVKRPEVLPAALSCRWDIVIVDEAHGVAPRRSATTRLPRFRPRAPYVVMLTATPHSGDQDAFAPSAASEASPVTGCSPFAVVATMQRSDRGAESIAFRYGRARDEPRMHAILERFTHAVRAEGGDRNRDSGSR